MSLISKGSYRFEEFKLDPLRRILTRDGERISVSPKSFELLLYLVKNAGQVILKDDLLKAVWPNSFVEESNLTQHIFWIRKALTDRASYIATIPGRGYEFTASVQADNMSDQQVWVEPDNPLGSEPEPIHLRAVTETIRVSFKETELKTTLPAARVQGRASRFRQIVVSVAVVVIGVTACGFWYRQNRVIPGDHHEVVLADFTNATPDHDFDHTLKMLLSIDLTQSPYLVVATDPEVHDILNLMGRPPDTPLTVTTALEVCQRLNDQVVLSGQIARFGQKYAISVAAMDCQNGRALVQSSAIADNRDGVIHAVDSVAATVRHRLGEPRFLQSPEHPLQPLHTVSLDALKVFSQAESMQNQSRETIPLYRRAVELDPQFAWGYAQLGMTYALEGEYARQKEYLTKAYLMRDQLNDYQRFNVTYDYEIMTGVDAQRMLLNLKSWSKLYPNQVTPLVTMSEVLRSLGRFEDAIAPARRAVELQPGNVGTYIALATALAESGHPQEMKAVCQEAFHRKLDSIFLRLLMYGVAIQEHDQAGIAEQDTWAKTQDDGVAFPAMRLMGEGKAHEAVKRWLQSVDDLRQQGFSEHADRRLRVVLHREAVYEMRAELREQMKSMDVTKYPEDLVYVSAEMGHIRDAQTGLRLYENERKQSVGSVIDPCDPPKAAVARALHKTQEAFAALEPCEHYGMAAPGQLLLLGETYLDVGKPQKAEVEFRYILEHSSVGLGFTEAMARLGLARALAQAGDKVEARKAYEAVFYQWKDADHDLPLLLQARREFAAIAQ